MNKLAYFCVVVSFIHSCTAEKVNFFPAKGGSEANAKVKVLNHRAEGKPSEISFYTQALTQACSSIPEFNDSRINSLTFDLKNLTKDYIYGIKSNDLAVKRRALTKIENIYKSIQKNRQYLNENENTIINRHLVKIKNSVDRLELLLDEESKVSLKQ
ncbi:MAG: hypothetical protein FDW93_01765 [Bergeyella sp.]|nr:hypothetical protein [Bergeyella sp.]